MLRATNYSYQNMRRRGLDRRGDTEGSACRLVQWTSDGVLSAAISNKREEQRVQKAKSENKSRHGNPALFYSLQAGEPACRKWNGTRTFCPFVLKRLFSSFQASEQNVCKHCKPVSLDLSQWRIRPENMEALLWGH